MYIKPKIYHSLDNATMKALYNIYIVPDVYYCNKLNMIVYIRILYNVVNAIIAMS